MDGIANWHMTPKATILRKLLECYEAIADYQTELLREIDYYEYQRVNVRGISYDPDKVPTASPSIHSTALLYDRQIEECRQELTFTNSLIRWIADQLQTLTEPDRQTLMERYTAKKTIDQMAAELNITPEQMKYRIYGILTKI